MQGRRIECPFAAGGGLVADWPVAGDYWKHPDPACGWQAMTPNGHMAGLVKHDVVEHEDGTITVSPSILVSNGSGPLWHGFLERGVWREC